MSALTQRTLFEPVRDAPLPKSWTVRRGENLEVLAGYPTASMHALVTDPPSGIEFMGKAWDKFADRRAFIDYLVPIFSECLRVLKPGASGFVWALPRTSHWTMTALEDAGFELRDRVLHLFGTGFPKGTNKAKIPAEWAGWNTALKPAVEDWVLVRKPLEGTLAENLEKHGCGALNIDGCRLGGDTRGPKGAQPEGWNHAAGAECGSALGRWPANITLDVDAAALLDQQTQHLREGGTLKGGEGRDRAIVSPLNLGPRGPWQSYGDSGGASRFFYVAKPGRSERDAGCEDLEAKQQDTSRAADAPGANNPRNRGGQERANHHPTVKPVALMRWLVRMVAPPGGLVLDPFAGSGTTGVAALAEGARFVGIERELEYFNIAHARLAHAATTSEAP